MLIQIIPLDCGFYFSGGGGGQHWNGGSPHYYFGAFVPRVCASVCPSILLVVRVFRFDHLFRCKTNHRHYDLGVVYLLQWMKREDKKRRRNLCKLCFDRFHVALNQIVCLHLREKIVCFPFLFRFASFLGIVFALLRPLDAVHEEMLVPTKKI